MATYGTAEVRIEADTTDFHRDLQRQLRTQRPTPVRVEPDTGQFAAQLRRDLRNLVAEIQLRADARRLVREIERELARIRPPQIQVDVTADTSRAASQLRSLDAPDVQVQVTADTDDAQAQIQGLIDDIPDPVVVPIVTGGAPGAGAAAGSGILAGITSALGGAGPWGAAAAAAAAGAVIVGAAFVAGLQEHIEQEQILGRFEAQLGATSREAQQYGRIAGELYARGVTETAQEGATAVQEAVRAGLDLKPGDLGLQGVSTALADLSTLLEEDIGQTARAVGLMVKTGLVDNAQEGFDLMTKGAQQGANAAGDLLELFSEYSTQFRQLGISGEEAMGLIQQGLRGGARDADTVADAMKEFSIEAAQGAERTNEAFEMLGMDAEKMSAAFAEGGPTARKALDGVFDALRDIEDPLERNQVAVGLFGTKAEDLAGALEHMDISTAAKEMAGFEGAATRAGDSLRDNLGTALTRVGREFQQALGGMFRGDLSGFADVGDAFRDAMPYIREALSGLGQALEDAVVQLGPRIPGIVFRLGQQIGQSIDQWGPIVLKGLAFLSAIPLAAGAALLTGLAGVLTGLWQKALPYLEAGWDAFTGFFTDTIPAFFAGLAGTLGEALGAAWGAAWAFVTEQMPQYALGVLDFFASLPGMIFEGLGMLAGLLVAAFVGAFTYLWEQIPIWTQNTIAFFQQLPDRIVDALAALGTMLSQAFQAAISFVTSTLPAAVGRILAFFRNLPGQAVSTLSSLGARLASAFSNALATAASRVSSGLQQILRFFIALPGQIRGALSTIGTGIWNGLRSALNAGIRLVNKAIDGFNKFSPVNVGKIPELADGGVLYQRTLAYVGEAGPEAVIPLMRPRRAAQIAEQSGLIDLLQKQGLVVRTGGMDRSQAHTWNITSNGSDPRALSQALYNRMTLATGV